MDRLRVELVGYHPYKEMVNGEQGYIDGYVRGADNVPYAVVIKLDGSISLCSTNQLKVISLDKEQSNG